MLFLGHYKWIAGQHIDLNQRDYTLPSHAYTDTHPSQKSPYSSSFRQLIHILMQTCILWSFAPQDLFFVYLYYAFQVYCIFRPGRCVGGGDVIRRFVGPLRFVHVRQECLPPHLQADRKSDFLSIVSSILHRYKVSGAASLFPC
jgi:hypothetical protein